MHATGEFSGRFLIFSLIATPLIMLLPKYKFPKWLNRNKRYFGVAAFTYGLYHTIVYLIEVPTNKVIGEFFEIGLLTARIALIIWVPMTITSTDGWVKQQNQNEKKFIIWASWLLYWPSFTGHLFIIIGNLSWCMPFPCYYNKAIDGIKFFQKIG